MSEESAAGKPTVFSEPTWAIVEIMGHNMLAGQVSEVTIAGAPMLRVDVPRTEAQPAYTKFLGAGAIYALTPVGEAEARTATRRLEIRPVTAWVVPDPGREDPARLPAGRGISEEELLEVKLAEEATYLDHADDYGCDEEPSF